MTDKNYHRCKSCGSEWLADVIFCPTCGENWNAGLMREYATAVRALGSNIIADFMLAEADAMPTMKKAVPPVSEWRVDAERYRWLKASVRIEITTETQMFSLYGKDLDKVIDIASSSSTSEGIGK